MTATLLLVGLGGVLVGGALSLRSQGAPAWALVLVGLLAALSLAGGLLRLLA